MSWQATGAVRSHSKITDPSGRCIMFTIATYCNAQGNMDGATYPPSYKTIAAGAGVHEQTVKNWIPKLQNSGELTMRKEGKGRGTKVFFTINLPMQNTCENSYPEKEPKSLQEITVQDDIPLINETVQGLQLMVQDLRETVQGLQLMVQGMVQNGISQSVPMNNNEVINEVKSEERTHARKPNHFDNFNALNRNKPMAQIELEQTIKAIITDKREHEKIEDSALIALGLDAKPADIDRLFGEDAVYWYQVGMGRDDKLPPYAKNIGTDLGRALRWEKNGSKVPASTTTPAQSNQKPLHVAVNGLY